MTRVETDANKLSDIERARQACAMGLDAADFVDGRSLSAVLRDGNLTKLSPDERTSVWRCFAALCQSHVMCETEKGIDGRIIHGSADVWNAEEFAPWTFEAPYTAVCGELCFNEPTRLDAVVRIAASARVFVRALYAGRLFVEGELHVLGTIDVLELNVSTNGFVSSAGVVVAR